MSKSRETKEVLAENVKRLREQFAPEGSRAMNTFSKHCGIGNSALVSLEGAVGNPSLDTLVKIADRFGLEPWHLFVPGVEPGLKPRIITPEEIRHVLQPEEAKRRIGVETDSLMKWRQK